jgi:hypothetical protein
MLSLLMLGALALQQPQELPPLPAEFNVQTHSASFHAGPSRTAPIVHKAKNGETVVVQAAEPPWLKCDLGAGKLGYVHRTALIAKAGYKPSAATEAEMNELSAKGQEAQRGFNEITEKEHRRLAGAQIDAGYVALDGLMGRPGFKAERGTLESRLAEFRKVGKLGEFSSVK